MTIDIREATNLLYFENFNIFLADDEQKLGWM